MDWNFYETLQKKYTVLENWNYSVYQRKVSDHEWKYMVLAVKLYPVFLYLQNGLCTETQGLQKYTVLEYWKYTVLFRNKTIWTKFFDFNWFESSNLKSVQFTTR